MNLPLFQSFSDATNLLSIENVSVLGLLLAFCAYQVWQNKLSKDDFKIQVERLEAEIKLKDDKIDQIIEEHRKDLKDSSKDAVEMVNRYHIFVEQLGTLTRNGRSHH